MSINSRKKGATAEREFASLVHDQLGVKLIRNLEQSRSGGYDLICVDDDPVSQQISRFGIEVKRYSRVTSALLREFWLQACEQAEKAEKIPALAYRENRSPWRVLIPMSNVNDGFTQNLELDYTAELSLAGFCYLVREKAELHDTPMNSVIGY